MCMNDPQRNCIYLIDGPANGQRFAIDPQHIPGTWLITESFLGMKPENGDSVPWHIERTHFYRIVYAVDQNSGRNVFPGYHVPIELPDDVAAIYMYDARLCRTR